MKSADFLWTLSGGSGNTSPAASLGGVKSSTVMANNVLQNVFANVTSGERASGSTKYRCLYIENASTEKLEAAVLFVATNTPSPGTHISIGIDPAGINGTAVTIPDEDTAPAGVMFDHSPPPTSIGTGLVLDSPSELESGDFVAVWLRRVVNPSTAALANDTCQVTLYGDPV